jgi:hypothetical protein
LSLLSSTSYASFTTMANVCHNKLWFSVYYENLCNS